MGTYMKLSEGDLDVLEDASTEQWIRNMCRNLVAEVRDLREEVMPRTKAVEVLCDAIDGMNDYNNKLREVIQAFQIRVAFIGHPYEPADWSEVIAMADKVLTELSAQETVYVQRMVLTQDNDGHWYLIPETEAKEFNDILADGYRWTEFEARWGDKRLSMHPSQYSFTDLQERKQ